jgi:hypothetical protein
LGLNDLTFTAKKSAYLIQISWELLEDCPFRLHIWTEEEWAAEIELRRGIRRALSHQPLASLKRAATKDIKNAEALAANWPRFGHLTYEDDPWRHRKTWFETP